MEDNLIIHKRRVGVAILGFGTVGNGVYHLLLEESKIQAKHGIGFDVRKILVRDLSSPKLNGVPKSLLTTKLEDITNDDSIEVVIEVIGGVSPTKHYIFESIKAGKHVITANKKLMGIKGEELVAKARQYGRFFGFAAAVTGCHQLCRSIVSSVMVRSIAGVFNGTSNYILTKMEHGLAFEDALAEAQKAGCAEADPTEDISGSDACNKLVILSKLAFGIFLDRDQIQVEGIEKITLADMRFADNLGYTIKLLGISRLTDDDKIEARVQPCFVPKGDLLASVKGVDNGVQVYDVLRGVQGMIASGAGSRPTAMAIFGDLMSMALNEPIIWPASFPANKTPRYSRAAATIGTYYVRVGVTNHPGVLAAITKILSRHEINIKHIVQHGDNQKTVPVVVMCGPVQERSIIQALKEINALTSVTSAAIFIRVEDQVNPTLSLEAA